MIGEAKTKNSFIDVTKQPDSILFQYDDSPVRFEEFDGKEEQNDKIDFDNGKITLYPCDRPIKRIKLRWRGDMSDVHMIYGDDIAMISVGASWSAPVPHTPLWWYFHTFDGEGLNSFGVKTGCSAFAFWQCDPFGITLWLDVRNGGGGVSIKEPFIVAETVCAQGIGDPFTDAQSFCAKMCPAPVLPEKPIFGVNNWYWAYGDISHQKVMEDCDYLMEMCRDAVDKPHMIIDDGWQYNHYFSPSGNYNGDPWDKSNSDFPSMRETADEIHKKGALSPDSMKRIQSIYRTASLGGEKAVPEKFVGQNYLSFFKTPEGKRYSFNWYREYDGTRAFFTWND